MSTTAAPVEVAGRTLRLRPPAGLAAGSGLAFAFLALVFLMVILGNVLAPFPPGDQDLASRLAPPFWETGGSSAHLLGTDQLGRDVLSRLMAGAKISVLVAVGAALLEAAIGIGLGLAAGHLGGRVERVIMWWVDVQMGFPAILVLIFIVLVLGGGPVVLIVAFALNGWMIFARVTRVTVRSIGSTGFVTAAVVSGADHRWVLRRHVIPHVRGPLLGLFLLEVPRLMLAESMMSFIGLGVQPPGISWGQLVGGSQDLIPVAYWLGLFPGIAIVLTVVSMYVVASFFDRRRGVA